MKTIARYRVPVCDIKAYAAFRSFANAEIYMKEASKDWSPDNDENNTQRDNAVAHAKASWKNALAQLNEYVVSKQQAPDDVLPAKWEEVHHHDSTWTLTVYAT